MTRHFFPVVLNSLRLGGPCSLPVGTSGSSSTLRMVTLFWSCKQLGGAEPFLFLPEVTSFHPSPFPEFSLTLMVGLDTACFYSTDGV